ncbi:MAG: hypothetical protein ACKVOU_13770 [Cytophagales bacterium]
MKKQTHYLLLAILLFAALLCGLQCSTPCKDSGKEYEMFSGYWKIVGYSRNGKDLLDSLDTTDTLQYVVFQAINRSQDRSCIKIEPGYCDIKGFSADLLGEKELSGTWRIKEGFLSMTIYDSKSVIKTSNGYKTFEKKWTIVYKEPDYLIPPFGLDINWNPIFKADTLQFTGGYQEDVYQLTLLKSSYENYKKNAPKF